MIVMKFGGTSVANFEAITRTIFIVGSKLDQKPVVVVSALSKVTDLLYKIADTAATQDTEQTKELLGQLRERNVNLVKELLEQSPMIMEQALERVNAICDDLDKLAYAVCAVGELSDRNKAIIISNGELLSSTIICFTMNAKGIKTGFIDARKMMVTNDSYLKGEPIVDEIAQRVPGIVAQAYEGMNAVITQGFIASNMAGEQTVLGRGGSDYSASLIGMAVDAERIEIWTDVDGVLTADPRRVKNTKYLEKISFEEAALFHIATFPLAALRKCKLELGESAIVMGMGILGMMAVKLLRVAGAAPLIAVDKLLEHSYLLQRVHSYGIPKL